MDSKKKVASLMGTEGLESKRGSGARREQDVPLVEIDSTFAKLLGLGDGQKVNIVTPILRTDTHQHASRSEYCFIETHP